MLSECFEDVGWSLAENQVSKQSFFRKHDFSAMVDKLVCGGQKVTYFNNINWDSILLIEKASTMKE